MQTQSLAEQTPPGLAAKIGAGFFALWGLLHLGVGYFGTHLYLTSPADGQWKMFAGGPKAPLDQLLLPANAVTAQVHAHVLLELCLDAAGYGLLGLAVAWLVYTRASWTAYFLGLFILGVSSLTYQFGPVAAGMVPQTFPNFLGTALWLLAVLIIPFGLPSLSKGLFRDSV